MLSISYILKQEKPNFTPVRSCANMLTKYRVIDIVLEAREAT